MNEQLESHLRLLCFAFILFSNNLTWENEDEMWTKMRTRTLKEPKNCS